MTANSIAKRVLATGGVLTASIIAFGGGIGASSASAAGASVHPDTCKSGYVWRDARPGDHVCVTPATRAQAQYDNSQAANRIASYGGSYGSTTCKSGYVWREAYAGDHVCVTPATRSQAQYDNAQAPYRRL